jgi:hypothetical protein
MEAACCSIATGTPSQIGNYRGSAPLVIFGLESDQYKVGHQGTHCSTVQVLLSPHLLIFEDTTG